MTEFLQQLDLSPQNADPVPPSGLASVAKPGDYIARKSRLDLYWHHGIMRGLGEPLGTFLVTDSFPHEGQPSVQTRTMEDFLGDEVEAAAIVRWGRNGQRQVYLQSPGVHIEERVRDQDFCVCYSKKMCPLFVQPK